MATTNYSWTLPTVGGSEDTWGDENNTLWTDLDTLLGGVTQAQFGYLTGLTSDVQTQIDAAAADPAIADITDWPATVSTTEVGYLDGVTSAIQTQLDAKALAARTITAGTGLTGGGDLSANRTLYVEFHSTAEAEAGNATGKAMDAALTKAAIDANAGLSSKMIVRHEVAHGTAGSSTVAGSWEVFDLNTVDVNGISGASLASNQITLPAGTYFIEVAVPLYKCNTAKTRLYDATNSAVLAVGNAVNSHSSYNSGVTSLIRTKLTLAGTTDIQVEAIADTSATMYSAEAGTISGDTEVEIYTQVKIEKVG